VSSHIAKYPTPGMGILGLKTLPPSIEILLENSSMEGTSIEFVILPPVLPLPWLVLGVSPPFMPGWLSSPVFTSQ
jgi:hypothetical protein